MANYLESMLNIPIILLCILCLGAKLVNSAAADEGRCYAPNFECPLWAPCCSRYGYCGNGPDHCDPKNCIKRSDGVEIEQGSKLRSPRRHKKDRQGHRRHEKDSEESDDDRRRRRRRRNHDRDEEETWYTERRNDYRSRQKTSKNKSGHCKDDRFDPCRRPDKFTY